MTNAENDAEIQVSCAIDEAQSLLSEAGFFKPLIRLTMEDKSKLTSVLISYHCMTKVKAAMDQFVEGLESLGVLEWIRSNPEKWKVFFMDGGIIVDAGTVHEVMTTDCYTIECICTRLKNIKNVKV